MAETDHLGVQIEHLNKSKSGLEQQNIAVRDCPSLVGGRPANALGVLNIEQYREFLKSKYNKDYSTKLYTYTLRYQEVYGNLSLLETIPSTVRNNALKSLVALSKYKGEYSEFHNRLKAHGIKWVSTDAFTSFTNVFNHNHDSLMQWYHDFSKFLRPNEQLWLRYLALSGLRRAESVMSFNKIVELVRAGNLSEYINDVGIIEHFRDKRFLRGTKNAFISILSPSLIDEVKSSESINWNALRKRMDRKHQRYRFKELRSFNGSFLVKNGLISEEVDLLQGRVSKSVFARHYLKENIGEFKSRVLEGNNKLETLLNSRMEMAITNRSTTWKM
jgi:intergrase/recombinase